jgi:hypothetical protein
VSAPLLQPAPRSAPPAPGLESFVVAREGTFGGRWFGVGDVVLCRGDVRNGDDTVLVALGHGRPRFGTRRNGRWHGDAGEPCAAERWRAAGRLVGRVRAVGGRHVVDLFAGEDEVQPWATSGAGGERASGGASVEADAARKVQLSLFAA